MQLGHAVDEAAASVDDDHRWQDDVHGHVVRVIEEGLVFRLAKVLRHGGGAVHLCRERLLSKQVAGQKVGGVDAPAGGSVGGWVDGRTDGWMDGWMDGWASGSPHSDSGCVDCL